MKRITFLIVLTGLLAGLLLAGCAPVTAPAPASAAPTLAASAAPTMAPAAVTTAPATAATMAPVATAAVPPAANTAAPAASAVAGQRAGFGGVSFTYPTGLAQGASGKSVPAGPSPDYPARLTIPRHVEIGLTGYVLTGTQRAPAVMVYPAGEFAASQPEVAARITALEALLKTRPADLTGIAGNGVPDLPFLPPFNGKQAMHFGAKYLTFQGGQGVRYLTQTGNGLSGIDNTQLFYTFQGLTADGKYYVSAILPVSHGSLPASFEAMPQSERDTIFGRYAEYLKETTAALAAQPETSFKPGLPDLDSLIQTLQIAASAS